MNPCVTNVRHYCTVSFEYAASLSMEHLRKDVIYLMSSNDIIRLIFPGMSLFININLDILKQIIDFLPKGKSISKLTETGLLLSTATTVLLTYVFCFKNYTPRQESTRQLNYLKATRRVLSSTITKRD